MTDSSCVDHRVAGTDRIGQVAQAASARVAQADSVGLRRLFWLFRVCN